MVLKVASVAQEMNWLDRMAGLISRYWWRGGLLLSNVWFQDVEHHMAAYLDPIAPTVTKNHLNKIVEFRLYGNHPQHH